MGSSNTDYKSEIDKGLAQANTPKSALAQNVESSLTGQAGNIYQNLSDQSAMSMPGKVLNAGQFDPRLTQSNTPNYSQFQSPFFNNFQGSQTNQINYSQPNQNNLFQNGSISAPQNKQPLNTPQQGNSSQPGQSNIDPYGLQANTYMAPSGGIPQVSDPTQNYYTNPHQNTTDTGYSPYTAQLPTAVDPNYNPSFGIQNIQNQQSQGGLQQGINNPNLSSSIQQALGYQNQNIQNQSVLGQVGQRYQDQGVNTNVGFQQQNLNPFNALGANLQNTQMGAINPNVNFQQQGLNPYQTQQANLSGIQQPSSVIQDSAYTNSLQQILQNQHQLDLGNIRARFGADGGMSRSTGASYAEAQLNAQELPQIAAALGQARQSEAGISNQLYGINSNNALQNAAQTNNSNLQARGQDQSQLQNNQQGNLQAQQATLANLLQGRGQDLSSLQNNNQNQLTQAGLLNQSNLQARGQDQSQLQANQTGNLQAQLNSGQLGLQQRDQNINAFNQGRTQDASLFNSAVGNNQASGANNNNLLSTLLGSQNQSNGLGLQDIQQQLQYALGQGSQNSSNSQFNAGQSNQLNQNYANNQFTGQNNQLSTQANAYNQLAGYLSQMAALGYPGGSANINVSPISQSGGSLGGLLSGAGNLLSGIGSL